MLVLQRWYPICSVLLGCQVGFNCEKCPIFPCCANHPKWWDGECDTGLWTQRATGTFLRGYSNKLWETLPCYKILHLFVFNSFTCCALRFAKVPTNQFPWSKMFRFIVAVLVLAAVSAFAPAGRFGASRTMSIAMTNVSFSFEGLLCKTCSILFCYLSCKELGWMRDRPWSWTENGPCVQLTKKKPLSGKDYY